MSLLETPNFKNGGSGAGHSKDEWQTEVWRAVRPKAYYRFRHVEDCEFVTGTDTINLKTAL